MPLVAVPAPLPPSIKVTSVVWTPPCSAAVSVAWMENEAVSSSSMVSVPAVVPNAAGPLGFCSVRFTVSFPSAAKSLSGVSETASVVPEVEPVGKVTAWMANGV